MTEVTAIEDRNSQGIVDACVGMSTRITLTLAEPRYKGQLHELYIRNRSSHKPWVYHGTTDNYFQKISAGRTIGLFIWRAPDQTLVGVINLNEPVMGGLKSAYLGYFIDSNVGGNGYMREAMTLALDYAFEQRGFHRLEANIQPGNDRSISLVKSLGFRLEGFSPKYLSINGVWRDHERWAILSEEWSARKLDSQANCL